MRKIGSHKKDVDIAVIIEMQLRQIARTIRATVKIRFKACSSQKMVRPIQT